MNVAAASTTVLGDVMDPLRVCLDDWVNDDDVRDFVNPKLVVYAEGIAASVDPWRDLAPEERGVTVALFNALGDRVRLQDEQRVVAILKNKHPLGPWEAQRLAKAERAIPHLQEQADSSSWHLAVEVVKVGTQTDHLISTAFMHIAFAAVGNPFAGIVAFLKVVKVCLLIKRITQPMQSCENAVRSAADGLAERAARAHRAYPVQRPTNSVNPAVQPSIAELSKLQGNGVGIPYPGSRS